MTSAVPGSATFTNGDTILGGGNTILKLFTDGGPSAIATVAGLGVYVDVVSVSDTTLQAVGWSNIKYINSSSGANGNYTFVDNLDRDTPLMISNITGSLSASFDVAGYGAYGWLYNGNPGTSTPAWLLVDSSNNVTATFGDMQSGSVDFFSGSFTIGDVDVMGGDSVGFFLYASASGGGGDDGVLGDVDVDLGDSSTFSAFLSASDDFTAGDFNVVGGDGFFGYISGSTTGDFTIGDIDMSAGTSSSLSVTVSATGSVDMGDVTLLAGTSSSLDLDVWGGGMVDVGDVDMEAGGFSSISVTISGSSDVNVGDAFLLASISSSLYYSLNAWDGDILAGDVTEMAGGSSIAYVGVFNTDSYDDVGDTTVGDINVTVGDSSSITVSVTASASISGDVGDVTVGDVNADAGDSSSISLNFGLYASSGDVGDLTVGDIHGAAGTMSHVSVDIWSSAPTGTAGDVSVGDIDLAIGGGTTLTYQSASISISHTASGGVGALTVGDVMMSGRRLCQSQPGRLSLRHRRW